MTELKATSKHPAGLFVLFFTEMWERFSYYGMRAIFTLYMTKALFIDKAAASNIYGSYTGLVYLTPLIGGYVADRYWGNRKSIFLGGLLMAIGQFLMFFSASYYQTPNLSMIFMLLGLSGLIIGNGFFKPNISTLVGQLYPRGDSRLDSAFTLFYMGINLGAFFSPIVCGLLGDTGNPADFKWGFLAAGIGMLFGIVSFELMKKKYLVTPEGEAVGSVANKKKDIADKAAASARGEEDTSIVGSISNTSTVIWAVVALVLIAVFHFLLGQDWIGSAIFSVSIAAPGLILSDSSLSKTEKERILVIFIAAFFVIFFWAAFEQAGASLTFFADEQMNRTVNVDTSYGVVYIVVAAFAGLLYYTLQRIMFIPREYKFLFGAIGLYLLFLIIKGFTYGEHFVLAEIPASAYNSVNAIFIVVLAPIFAELWGKLGRKNLEPASPYKQALGLLFLSLGYVVIAVAVKGLEPGIKISMMWLIGLYLLHTIGELCLSPIGLSLVNKLAPVRFASVLMGTWFLANATANKFAGTLSALYPEAGKPTVFMGYEMTNMYDFFVLFIVMSGVASLILFVASKWLLKMMHGVR